LCQAAQHDEPKAKKTAYATGFLLFCVLA